MEMDLCICVMFSVLLGLKIGNLVMVDEFYPENSHTSVLSVYIS